MAATNEISVKLREGWLFEIDNGRHTVFSDQPAGAGGGDAAPSPVELFVGSIVACVGVFARMYLERHALPFDGLEVKGVYGMAPAPNRVGSVEIRVQGLGELDDATREALLTFVKRCTVHNSLYKPPTIEIGIADGARSA